MSREDTARFLQAQIDKERAARNTAEAELQQTKLAMQALIEEFTNASDEEAPEKIRKNIRGRIPTALSTLDDLLLTGSDSLKANIAKFFVTQGLLPTDSENAGMELEKLLTKLGVND